MKIDDDTVMNFMCESDGGRHQSYHRIYAGLNDKIYRRYRNRWEIIERNLSTRIGTKVGNISYNDYLIYKKLG